MAAKYCALIVTAILESSCGVCSSETRVVDCAEHYATIVRNHFAWGHPEVDFAVQSLRASNRAAIRFLLSQSRAAANDALNIAALISRMMAPSDDCVYGLQSILLEEDLGRDERHLGIIALAMIADNEAVRIHAVVSSLCAIIRSGDDDACHYAAFYLSATDFVRTPLERRDYGVIAGTLYSLQDRSFDSQGLIRRGVASDKLVGVLSRGGSDAAASLINARSGRVLDIFSEAAFLQACSRLGSAAHAAIEIVEGLKANDILRNDAERALREMNSGKETSRSSTRRSDQK